MSSSRPASPNLIDAELLGASDFDSGFGLAFICGSNGFVEAASDLLLDGGFAPQRIRTERFGPTS